jgi:hypothetical protein
MQEIPTITVSSPLDHHAAYLSIELLPVRNHGGSRVSSSSLFDSAGIDKNRNMMDDVLIANCTLSFRDRVSSLLITWSKQYLKSSCDQP